MRLAWSSDAATLQRHCTEGFTSSEAGEERENFLFPWFSCVRNQLGSKDFQLNDGGCNEPPLAVFFTQVRFDWHIN